MTKRYVLVHAYVGKSSVLKLLGARLIPSSGTISVNGLTDLTRITKVRGPFAARSVLLRELCPVTPVR